MALSESYQCDVCSAYKTDSEDWWLSWIDCFSSPDKSDQPLLKFTRWQNAQAHSAGVKHLCGVRCANTFMDRWMTEQHENPDAHCR